MTNRPPYQKLRAAEVRAARAHPHADCVHAVWTPASSNEIVVEVWTNGSAKMVIA